MTFHAREPCCSHVRSRSCAMQTMASGAADHETSSLKSKIKPAFSVSLASEAWAVPWTLSMWALLGVVAQASDSRGSILMAAEMVRTREGEPPTFILSCALAPIARLPVALPRALSSHQYDIYPATNSVSSVRLTFLSPSSACDGYLRGPRHIVCSIQFTIRERAFLCWVA